MSKRKSTKSWILGSYLVYSFLAFLNKDEAAMLVYAKRKSIKCGSCLSRIYSGRNESTRWICHCLFLSFMVTKNIPLSPSIIAVWVWESDWRRKYGWRKPHAPYTPFCMPMHIPRRLSMCNIKIHRSLSPLITGPKKYFVCLLSVSTDIPDVTMHIPLRTASMFS